LIEPVTIIIPHYRAPVIVDCLESLYSCSNWPIKVLVIDDGNRGPILQKAISNFPQMKVLSNEKNLGFTGSCNRGLNEAKSKYAVLLNDDTRVTQNWLQPLVECAEANPSIAACQPKLLSAVDSAYFDYGGGAGGYIDGLGYTFCRGRILDHREEDMGQYETQRPLFWACGSALFLRLEAAREINFLDKEFFMHFEEIDLCWRLQSKGYRIWSVPKSVVYHHSGYSLPPDSFRKTYLNHRNNLIMNCKNRPLINLLWLLPIRIPLELLAAIGYLGRKQWRSVMAPIASLFWCMLNIFAIYKRRKETQAEANFEAQDGIYSGSILYQYYIRGCRHAKSLMPE